MLLILILFLLLAVLLGSALKRHRPPPPVGALAPAFSLPDQAGQTHALADTHGTWRVLFFYPRDHTPGCTREVCGLRDQHADLTALGAHVFGISVDSVERHAEFARAHRLPYPLLADRDGAVAAAYGSLLRVGPLRVARRNSFIVDPTGRIAAVFTRVDPTQHAAALTAQLRACQSTHAAP